MTGALNEMLAREHTLDLLCAAEQQRAVSGLHDERRRLRRALDVLLARRPRRNRSSEGPQRGERSL
jgi:hypothetical protein